MLFIREVLKFNPEHHIAGAVKDHRIIIRTNTYGSNFAFFQKLFEEVKKDFPELTPEKAEILHYGGRHYKGTYGIEFNIPISREVPSNYKEVSSVEYKL